MTRLGDLVAINPPAPGGAEPRSSIALRDIDPLSATATLRPVRSADAGVTHRRVALPGDILFAQISPSMENGKLALVPEHESGAVFVSGELLVLRPIAEVAKEQIWAFLRRNALRDVLSGCMVGTARRRLGREILEAVEIPVVSPQRWAVAADVLARLDRAVSLRRRLFTEIPRLAGVASARAAAGRERIRLGEVAKITSGIPEGGVEAGEVPLVGAADLRHGSIEAATPTFAPERRSPPPLLDRGDLLVARTGAALGRAAVYEGEPRGASFGTGLARVGGGRPFPGDFLWAWLQTAEARQNLDAGTSGSVVPSLALVGLAELRVPEPGRRRIQLASFAHALRMALRAGSRQLELCEDLLQAHLAQVFDGAVGAPKPVAGPAPSEEVPEFLHGVFRSASPAQREIWLKAAGMRGRFRVSDLIDSDVDRALLQHTLSILEQLGLLICERDGVIASWRLPHAEDDLVA